MGKQIDQKVPQQESNKKQNDASQDKIVTNQDQVNLQNEQASRDATTFKKKIIKKILHCKNKGQLVNEKQWRPKTIQQSKLSIQKGEQARKKGSNSKIAQTFLSTLPKPMNQIFDKPKFHFDGPEDQEPIQLHFQRTRIISKDLKQNLPLNQQGDEKVEVEDQFVFKRPPTLQQIQKNFRRDVQVKMGGFQQLQNQLIEPEPQFFIVKGRNNTQKQVKMRQINLGKVIDKEWKQSNASLNSQKNMNLEQYWRQSGLPQEMKGKMSAQAIQKYMNIEEELNKRQFQKKKMKSRYGW